MQFYMEPWMGKRSSVTLHFVMDVDAIEAVRAACPSVSSDKVALADFRAVHFAESLDTLIERISSKLLGQGVVNHQDAAERVVCDVLEELGLRRSVLDVATKRQKLWWVTVDHMRKRDVFRQELEQHLRERIPGLSLISCYLSRAPGGLLQWSVGCNVSFPGENRIVGELVNIDLPDDIIDPLSITAFLHTRDRLLERWKNIRGTV